VTPDRPRFFYGYVIVGAAFCVALLMWGTYYSFGVFYESLLLEFGWPRAQTSGAFSVSLLVSGLLCIVMGRLTDRFGPRIVVTACGIFLSTGFLLMSRVGSMWELYLFYGGLVAVGMAAAFVPLASTIARWFVKRRGMMTGLVVAGVGAGTMIIAPVARWLIYAHGWRSSYLILGAASLVVITVAAQFLRRDPQQIGESPYGDEEAGTQLSDCQTASFSLREAVRTRQLWLLSAAYFFGFFSIGTMLVHIVIHATGLGIPPLTASSILGTIGAVSVAGRITMGAVADRAGNKRCLLGCLGLLTAALVFLLTAREVWMLYLFAVLLGFAYGGMNSLQPLVTADLFGTTSLGAILGIVFALDSTGCGVGPVVAGRIFDVAGTYQPAFVVCIGAALVALALILPLRPLKR